MLRHLSVVAIVSIGMVLTPPPANADALFEDVVKDFGSVPRGTILTHQFQLKNVTTGILHVSGVRTSCTACTAVTVGKEELRPGEISALAVTVDTRKFVGSRTFTIFVQFDRPFVEEARLVVQVTSRDEVTLEPGQLAFGRVKKGVSPKASVLIEYHGSGPWQITGVENENGYIVPELQKITRGPGETAYQLVVRLREDTPVGAWHSDVWLRTTDTNVPRIRVPLLVEIEPNVTATPREVALGQVRPDARVERKVVIRSGTPFKVLRVDGADERVQVTGGNEESKSAQVLRVTFDPNGHNGDFSRTIRVLTDVPGEDPVEFTVQAFVAP